MGHQFFLELDASAVGLHQLDGSTNGRLATTELSNQRQSSRVQTKDTPSTAYPRRRGRTPLRISNRVVGPSTVVAAPVDGPYSSFPSILRGGRILDLVTPAIDIDIGELGGEVMPVIRQASHDCNKAFVWGCCSGGISIREPSYSYPSARQHDPCFDTPPSWVIARRTCLSCGRFDQIRICA